MCESNRASIRRRVSPIDSWVSRFLVCRLFSSLEPLRSAGLGARSTDLALRGRYRSLGARLDCLLRFLEVLSGDLYSRLLSVLRLRELLRVRLLLLLVPTVLLPRRRELSTPPLLRLPLLFLLWLLRRD